MEGFVLIKNKREYETDEVLLDSLIVENKKIRETVINLNMKYDIITDKYNSISNKYESLRGKYVMLEDNYIDLQVERDELYNELTIAKSQILKFNENIKTTEIIVVAPQNNDFVEKLNSFCLKLKFEIRNLFV